MSTNASGIKVKPGRGGGVFAHKDIAFKFAAWISAEFELYIVKDYQRLKYEENSRISLEWNVTRILSKVNYRIHTDAIKQNLIPEEISAKQKSFVYADEADLLNVALFGISASQWRNDNKGKSGNIRDYATIEQLLVLSNLENINAVYINNGMLQNERIVELNHIARTQLSIMLKHPSVETLKNLEKNED